MKKIILAVLLCSAATIAGAEEMPQTAKELGLMEGFPPDKDKRVTMLNMSQPPYNRWAYQHMRELVPTRNIAVPAESAPLDRRPVDLSELKVPFPDGRQVEVGQWLESAYTDGFIVLQDGRVVYERYFNDQLPATPHIMYSVTKSFVGTMMLMLMEQGLVDPAKPVEHYIPELSDSAFGDATVQQMLDMTNSISFTEVYTDPKSDIGQFGYAFSPGGEGLYTYLQSLTRHDEKFKHGEAFHYVTPDPEVLAWIIRRVTGKSLAAVMEEFIWTPLGAEHAGNYWLDFHGTEMAGGGLSISLRDAARFGQMILQDGKFNGRQVVSSTIAKRIKTKKNFEQFTRFYDDAWYGEVADSYHDQWWGYTGVDAVAAIGVHGQIIYINSTANVVIAKHTSDPEAENYRTDNETVYIMNAIAAHLAGGGSH